MIVNKSVSPLFFEAIDYQNYRLIKNSARYDDDSGSNLNKMTRKTAVQMKDRTLHGKEFVPIITVLQDHKVACDACDIHERATI